MTRPQLVDCPECACLIAVDESSCPFCGATPRRVAMSSLLGLGFILGLTTASCGDKEGATQGTMTTSNTEESTGGTTADTGPTTSSTDPDPSVASVSAYAGPSSDDDTFASSVAYAGPPDTDDTVTSSTNATEMGGTSAYAGPASTSSATETDPGTGTGTETETESDTGTGTGTGTSTGTDTGTT